MIDEVDLRARLQSTPSLVLAIEIVNVIVIQDGSSMRLWNTIQIKVQGYWASDKLRTQVRNSDQSRLHLAMPSHMEQAYLDHVARCVTPQKLILNICGEQHLG